MIRDFTYLKPSSLSEALKMLKDYGEEAKIICGGQSLLILMRQGMVTPSYLMDIKHLDELRYIRFDERNGARIGATATHREIERSPLLRQHYPVLPEMERRLATIQTRNWGTIGGNLAHADPAGDPGPVLVALGASVTLKSLDGERTIPLEEFFVDYFETALRKDEILYEVSIPKPQRRSACTYTKFNLIESDMGIVSCACFVALEDGEVMKDVKIVLGNAGPVPLRARRAEEMLKGKRGDEGLFEEVAKVCSEDSQPVTDIHASEEYRRHLVYVLAKRMLRKAFSEAKVC
jgi:carbon-monoxide dehydrogenase medium subunit